MGRANVCASNTGSIYILLYINKITLYPGTISEWRFESKGEGSPVIGDNLRVER